MRQPLEIPVVDLFAGPGGLGEGFSSFSVEDGWRPFRVRLSIENDPYAFETLRLRAFFRKFDPEHVPDDYYRYLRGETTKDDLFRNSDYRQVREAVAEEVLLEELGRPRRTDDLEHPGKVISNRIRTAIGRSGHWVLIGGPPCQAYSVVGRSRMMGANRERYEGDPRHTLYREYLRIIRDHRPPAFVMENVKGILSSQYEGREIFTRILNDLRSPAADLSYRLFSFSVARGDLFETYCPRDFVVQSEDYGIPQTRHRVFVLGVRSDISARPSTLARKAPPTVREVIEGLPNLCSLLSGVNGDREAWTSTLRAVPHTNWLRELEENQPDLASVILIQVQSIAPGSCGDERFVPGKVTAKGLESWLVDERLGGACNHAARSHMAEDLHRYLFAACYALTFACSPKLRDFPEQLLPNHKNVAQGVSRRHFADRFRVQIWDQPSTTITSHIAKDGHYYIHPDPSQCRSLTVREAARLQTFPDNYFFEGPRTAQYRQVGNAVPPLLAREIARIVYGVLCPHETCDIGEHSGPSHARTA